MPGKGVASEKRREPAYIARKGGVIRPMILACQIFNDPLEFGVTANSKRKAISGSSAMQLLRILLTYMRPRLRVHDKTVCSRFRTV